LRSAYQLGAISCSSRRPRSPPTRVLPQHGGSTHSFAAAPRSVRCAVVRCTHRERIAAALCDRGRAVRRTHGMRSAVRFAPPSRNTRAALIHIRRSRTTAGACNRFRAVPPQPPNAPCTPASPPPSRSSRCGAVRLRQIARGIFWSRSGADASGPPALRPNRGQSRNHPPTAHRAPPPPSRSSRARWPWSTWELCCRATPRIFCRARATPMRPRRVRGSTPCRSRDRICGGGSARARGVPSRRRPAPRSGCARRAQHAGGMARFTNGAADPLPHGSRQ
jgi:hypothetical protein